MTSSERLELRSNVGPWRALQLCWEVPEPLFAGGAFVDPCANHRDRIGVDWVIRNSLKLNRSNRTADERLDIGPNVRMRYPSNRDILSELATQSTGLALIDPNDIVIVSFETKLPFDPAAVGIRYDWCWLP